jgi:hypothetical protein
MQTKKCIKISRKPKPTLSAAPTAFAA